MITPRLHLEPSSGATLDWPPTGAIDSGDTYGRYAETYDVFFGDVDEDVEFYLAAAKSHVPAHRKLLEIGVGSGRLTERLLDNGHRVVGIDASPEMLSLAAERFGRNERVELRSGDIRDLTIDGAAFPLAIAPYGMVAHLLTDDDRLAAFRNVFALLDPGGVFIFDDCPVWLGKPDDGTTLNVAPIRDDRDGPGTLRLMTNTIEAAEGELSARYDFIDRLDQNGRVLKRTIVRIVFRNIMLPAELQLLKQAGFGRVDVLGGFDGRPFDATQPGTQTRLVLRCHRSR